MIAASSAAIRNTAGERNAGDERIGQEEVQVSIRIPSYLKAGHGCGQRHLSDRRNLGQYFFFKGRPYHFQEP